jgi:hypothetical protein
MLHKLKGVFKSLQENDVRYLVIGGIAAALHGVPRPTFDVDVLIDPEAGNVRRLLKAFSDAGLTTAELTDVESIQKNEITIFNDYVRIDVQTFTPGIRFEDAWARHETMTYQGQAFLVVSKQDLIASKRAAGRPVDLQDVAMLEAGAP